MASTYTEISLTGNKTLSATINVSNENRQSALFFTDGGLASSPTVTVANEENWWFVRNGTGFAITFTAGGDTATIADGNIAVVICDGTDCIAPCGACRDLCRQCSGLAASGGFIRLYRIHCGFDSHQRRNLRFQLPRRSQRQDHDLHQCAFGRL